MAYVNTWENSFSDVLPWSGLVYRCNLFPFFCLQQKNRDEEEVFVNCSVKLKCIISDVVVEELSIIRQANSSISGPAIHALIDRRIPWKFTEN